LVRLEKEPRKRKFTDSGKNPNILKRITKPI